jgi:hypothetical protein
MKSYRTHTVAYAVVLCFGARSVALADDEPVKPSAGTSLSDVLTTSGLAATGYVSASYYHSNGYGTDHQFDNKHDSFQLDQAALTLAYQPKEGFGALVNVAAGEDMKILNGAEGSSPNSFDIIQGYVQYVGGPVTIIGGKFVTLAGAEVIAPTGNTNFSRSLLFYAEPLTHTGIRATFAVTDTLNLVAGVNNGWNYSSLTTSGSKTAEVGLAWTPNKEFALAAQAYVGKDATFDAEKTLVDAVATYNATDALIFVLSVDWGKQEQHTGGDPQLAWYGAAFYTNYAFDGQWRLSLRLEYLDDKEGFVTGTGLAQRLEEGTLTLGYDPNKNFELRMEARYDKSTQPTFVRALGTGGATDSLADSQGGFALQATYKF